MKVKFIESNGTVHEVQAQADLSLMQIAQENGIKGIVGECGGSCSCGTCHVYIEAPWQAMLPPAAEAESYMLEGVLDRKSSSRLGCQICMNANLDGVEVRLPASQF